MLKVMVLISKNPHTEGFSACTQRLILETHQVFGTMFMHLPIIPTNFVIGSLYGSPGDIYDVCS